MMYKKKIQNLEMFSKNLLSLIKIKVYKNIKSELMTIVVRSCKKKKTWTKTFILKCYN